MRGTISSTKAERDGFGLRLTQAREACRGNCICHLASTNEDAVANARLIAAAPELLEAIEETIQSVVINKMHDTIEISRDAIESLRAALAKAKGGA